jgi:hypothetical protein
MSEQEGKKLPHYGPEASKSRSELKTDELVELFDWSSDQIRNGEDGIVMASLQQAVACKFSDISYWQSMAIVKNIMQSPGFKKQLEIQTKIAEKTLTTPMD